MEEVTEDSDCGPKRGAIAVLGKKQLRNTVLISILIGYVSIGRKQGAFRQPQSHHPKAGRQPPLPVFLDFQIFRWRRPIRARAAVV